MHKFWPMGALAALLAGTLAAPGTAQESQGPKVLEIGEMAPDFELAGATRYGVCVTP